MHKLAFCIAPTEESVVIANDFGQSQLVADMIKAICKWTCLMHSVEQSSPSIRVKASATTENNLTRQTRTNLPYFQSASDSFCKGAAVA
eukprot:4058645-Amphidinium_carterae.1